MLVFITIIVITMSQYPYQRKVTFVVIFRNHLTRKRAGSDFLVSTSMRQPYWSLSCLQKWYREDNITSSLLLCTIWILNSVSACSLLGAHLFLCFSSIGHQPAVTFDCSLPGFNFTYFQTTAWQAASATVSFLYGSCIYLCTPIVAAMWWVCFSWLLAVIKCVQGACFDLKFTPEMTWAPSISAMVDI
jgi:hypothetical protein